MIVLTIYALTDGRPVFFPRQIKPRLEKRLCSINPESMDNLVDPIRYFLYLHNTFIFMKRLLRPEHYFMILKYTKFDVQVTVHRDKFLQ